MSGDKFSAGISSGAIIGEGILRSTERQTSIYKSLAVTSESSKSDLVKLLNEKVEEYFKKNGRPEELEHLLPVVGLAPTLTRAVESILELAGKLEGGINKFVFITGSGKKTEAILDLESGLIWSEKLSDKSIDKSSFDSLAFKYANFYGWKLPSAEQLCNFAKKEHPFRSGRPYRILDKDYFITQEGRIDLDNANPSNYGSGSPGKCIPVSDNYRKKFALLIADCLITGRKIYFDKDRDTNLLKGMLKEVNAVSALAGLDSFSLPSPALDQRQISDQACGLWEFWNDESDEQGKQANLECLRLGVRPRNPAQDIQQGAVAIDFGTSSTVVAYKDGGRKKLLRIGLSLDDYSADSQPEHYENPTILEFVDLESLLQPWQSQAYRPRVSWEDVHCSHEALSTQRDNEADPKITASILPKIKQWALRMEDDLRIRVRDRANEKELELPPLEKRNPVTGKPLNVSPDDAFDPIELYAWFLGLAINQRSRGLFLKYYMTFPVAYPRSVKDKILCSFRRGLQRSLPETLVSQKEFEKFAVEERASEPAAFAAAALEHFSLEPTEQGVAYGVFDFGGGTTDFDFGVYRLPTEEEEELGFEQVIEHFGASGDRFLGGENLLENMAYQVFKHNADICREMGITFSKPLDADDFPASETLLSSSQAALTNTQMLMARLRPFWEKGERKGQSGVETLGLIGNEGTSRIELKVPYDELENYLKARLREGVDKFQHSMKEAFDQAGKQPEKIHVFLAGNASRSPLLQALFNKGENPSLERTITLKVSDARELLEAYHYSEDDEWEAFADQMVGVEVKSGDNLVLLDSGRSAGYLLSPVDGVIRRMFFENNESVDVNSPLLEIALSEDSDYFPDSSGEAGGPGEADGLDKADSTMQVYPPIMSDPSSPYSPTTKTGVALGLLELCPGSATAIVNHSANQKGGEAPFNFYVGAIKRRRFTPKLVRHARFNEWQELGIIREGFFNLVYTQNPASTLEQMEEGDLELNYQALDLPSDPGSRAYARAVSSNQIEVCSAANLEALNSTGNENQQTIVLTA